MALGAWSDAEHEATKQELDAQVSAALKEAERYGSLADGIFHSTQYLRHAHSRV